MPDFELPKRMNMLQYLVQRRYPVARQMHASFAVPPSGRVGPPPVSAEEKQSVEAYQSELAALSLEELVARFEGEKRREADELRARAEREEQERFYNNPQATADFDYWSRAAHWTLDEAITLSFGKAPERVSWDRLKGHVQVSPFAFQYSRRRELAQRALAWKQLYDPVFPGFFLAWAKRTDIPVPAELTLAVESRGLQVADWKTNYDDAIETLKAEREFREKVQADWQRMYDELRAQLNKNHADWSELAGRKNERIASLEADLASLAEALTELPEAPPEEALRPRERDSLLKLIIGMAVVGYVYDRKLARSPTPKEIADDLALAGVPLDVDTVRKWLVTAAELLPTQ